MGKRILLAVFVLVLAVLACGQPAEEYELRGWTVTPSQVTNTPTLVVPTQTPYIVEITNTPEPTRESVGYCVNALIAVHLRPSPSDENYPITALPNGSQVNDLGGRSGKWFFVQYQDKQGWINSDYLGACNE